MTPRGVIRTVPKVRVLRPGLAGRADSTWEQAMLLIAVAGSPGSTPSPLLLLAAAGAVSAVGWATLAVARSLAKLRTELEAYKESQRPAPPVAQPGRPGRPSAPTFGGLYEARPSPLAGLGEQPWTLPLLAGGACTVLALLLGFSSRPAAPEGPDPAQEVAAMRAALDSVAGRVKILEDTNGDGVYDK
ncbi:MAG TPA: hypothetical protein PKA50_18855, partial [Gemmatimonadales bacterium]|nr:hypothetical protein [Gemmatimonadales bacterium]